MRTLSQALECGTGKTLPVFPGVGSDQLLKMLLTPQNPSPDNQLGCQQSIYTSILQKIGGHAISRPLTSLLQSEVTVHKPMIQQHQLPLVHQQILPSQNCSVVDLDGTSEAHTEKPGEQFVKETPSEKSSQVQTKAYKSENTGENLQEVAEKSDASPGVLTEQVVLSSNHESIAPPVISDEQLQSSEEVNPQLHKPESSVAQLPDLKSSCSLDKTQSFPSSENVDNGVWMPQHSSYQSFTGPSKEPDFLSISAITDPFETFPFPCFSDPHTPQCLPSYLQEFFSCPEVNIVHEEVVGSGIMSFDAQKLETKQQENDLQKISNSCGMRDLSDESINQSETYSNLQFEATNGNMISGSCVSSAVIEGLSSARDSSFCIPSEDLFSSFTCNQDLQSQVTSANLADSQLLPLQDIPEGSSASMDVKECNFLNRYSTKQVAHQPFRTYTKV